MSEGENLQGYHAIKAVGDWELEVLAIPYGGPFGGKDSHGDYFGPETELYLDNFRSPPVVYYHGYDDNKKPMGKPEIIGKTTGMEKRDDGVWVRVVLDKANQFAQRVWESAKKGLARASSGTIHHMMRKAVNGLITHWPFAELTMFETETGKKPANPYAVALPVMKSMYEQAGIEWPDTQEAETPETEAREADAYSAEVVQEAGGDTNPKKSIQEETDMDINELTKLLDERDAAKAAAEAQAREAEATKKAEVESAVKAALEVAEKRWEAEAAKANRLPGGGGMPHVTKYHETRKYDGLDAADTSFLIETLNSATDSKVRPAPDAAYKALALKLSEDKTEGGEIGFHSLKAAMGEKGASFKSDEVMQQDLSGYGDEWVGVAYATSLWEAIRVGTFVLNKIRQIEVPQGYESIYLPLEGADPTFYKVAETTAHDSTMLFPVASVTSSKMATSRAQLTLAKMGARVPWSGELQEDSLIPFVNQLRMQLAVAGAENLEHVLIDGDTATAKTTNINDIGDPTTQGGTEVYLVANGFRKSPLVTTTANSRSGGVLTVEDWLETLKLMGTAGINALDVSKVGFIMDVNTHWKALTLEEVKTRDSYAQPTIEGGKLTSLWGYDNFVSAQMHRQSTNRKVNTSGKVDQTTTTNNTTGALLAVRWDQWLFGWRRRMTMETTRYPRSDSYEITALMRFGLKQRDTEASAITYNITL